MQWAGPYYEYNYGAGLDLSAMVPSLASYMLFSTYCKVFTKERGVFCASFCLYLRMDPIGRISLIKFGPVLEMR